MRILSAELRQTAKESIKNGIKHTVTYHPVGKAVVSVTDRLPSLAHGVVDAGASSAKMGERLFGGERSSFKGQALPVRRKHELGGRYLPA